MAMLNNQRVILSINPPTHQPGSGHDTKVGIASVTWRDAWFSVLASWTKPRGMYRTSPLDEGKIAGEIRVFDPGNVTFL